MHTLNRLLTLLFLVLLLLVVLVPSKTFRAVLSLDDKREAEQSLTKAINTAVSRYRERTGAQALKSKGEQIKNEQEGKLAALEKRKFELRKALIEQRRIVRFIENKYGIAIKNKEQIKTLIAAEKNRLVKQLREQYVRNLRMIALSPGDVILDAMFDGSTRRRDVEVVSKVQRKFLQDLVAAEKAVWRIETIVAQREETLQQYHAVQKSYDTATAMIERSDEQMAEIKRITAEVHEQVLKLQGNLARIDARLKSKAERALIEKGLLDPKDAGAAPTVSARPMFSWPVYGPISAGFKNANYQKYFGVPHYAVDIVVGQGTPVSASADGVVFLARDGGKTGYSYILIGHRGGYATLYGHMNVMTVTAGQEVDAGQTIGLSGGKPGTYGAGPMTTGPHVHFEVIQAGVNIDPKTVLP